MNSNKKSKQKIKETFINSDIFVKIYSYFHLFITFAALILCYYCSKKDGEFNKRTFAYVFCWPHIYILYIAATRGLFACMSSNAEVDDSSSSEM